ncbi:nucleolar protein 8 [Rhynchocyon petersi]
MKANGEMKRLFVGGLTQAISQTDLQNQFSRFGEVSDVEIITRKDEQGNPQKIFAYINLRLAEADLNKCMSVLNKTKWKGGTLQIQQAKESILHRLAQEREDVKAKTKNSRKGNPDLLRKIDLHMKAVPGTEVPRRKNWVVSKFGRILPVLHLKNRLKLLLFCSFTFSNIKYDPSKYCHNLKKIENSTDIIPITSLTWKLEEGKDPMSKKRQGEFLDCNRTKKTMKEQCGEGATKPLAVYPRPSTVLNSPHELQQYTAQNTLHDSVSFPESPSSPNFDLQKSQNVPFQTCGLDSARYKNASDDDIDSEDELRATVARKENLTKTVWSSIKVPESDPFVVVRDGFKSDGHKLCYLTSFDTKNNDSCQVSNDNETGNDCNYDSEDTDDIIAVGKTNYKNKTRFLNKKSICKNIAFKDRKDWEFSGSLKIPKRDKKAELGVSDAKHLDCKSLSGSHSSEDADSVSKLAKSERDKVYNTMMESCPHLNLTLANVKQLDCPHAEALKENTKSHIQETDSCCQFVRTSESLKNPVSARRGKQCIHPEEIIASLLEGRNICHKQKPKEDKFQAFKGIGSLYGKETRKNSRNVGVAADSMGKDPNSLKHDDPNNNFMGKGSLYSDVSSRKLILCQQAKKVDILCQTNPEKTQVTFESQGNTMVSPVSSAKRNRSISSNLLPLNDKCAGIHKIDFCEDGHPIISNIEAGSEEESTISQSLTPEKSPKVSSGKHGSKCTYINDTQESKSDSVHSVSNSSDVMKDRYAQDNEKRLAALDAKKKAKELQKKLVHTALANLDDHSEIKSTHIIFGSDSESDSRELSFQEQSHPEEEPVKQFISKASGKLFDSSSDEDSSSENDSNRFKIKPQFEGRAGQKLMDLQSHFGNDDRFQMDSRFLESESEEEQKEITEKKTLEKGELTAEKKKALDIMQQVLCLNLSSSISTRSVTAKKFKDIIHYDPTRHDHTTFERKTDDKPKERKAKQKKKRAEGEKLPEVSKEMYYDIAMDLKERLQTTKDASEKKENTPWSEGGGRDRAEEACDSVSLKKQHEEPAGFTFSFFDADAKDVKKDTYRVQTVKHGKSAWQGDSSSEEQDPTEDNHRKPNLQEMTLPQKENDRFFFFFKNDEKLHVGSEFFWRGIRSNLSRNSWEARTNSLRLDCRKKHKDAKRKVKPK